MKLLHRIHAPAFIPPRTFPHTLSSDKDIACGVSRLTTTSATAQMMSNYEVAVRECIKRGIEVAMEQDDLKELGSDLRNLAEQYSGEDGWEEGEGAEMSEDEEW